LRFVPGVMDVDAFKVGELVAGKDSSEWMSGQGEVEGLNGGERETRKEFGDSSGARGG
jgi:hypothetical protein